MVGEWLECCYKQIQDRDLHNQMWEVVRDCRSEGGEVREPLFWSAWTLVVDGVVEVCGDFGLENSG